MSELVQHEVIEEAVEPLKQNAPSIYSDIKTFEEGQRMASALAKAKLIPEIYRNDIPNAMIALELAQRLNTSPLTVMQNLYVVHGKPAWSSQYLIACWNAANPMQKLRFKTEGTGDDRFCLAYTVNEITGEIMEGIEVSIAMAKAEGWFTKNGSKWKTIPDLMLRYRAATFFVRTYAPELTAGIHTSEEVRDSIDLTKAADGSYQSPADALNATMKKETASNAS